MSIVVAHACTSLVLRPMLCKHEIDLAVGEVGVLQLQHMAYRCVQ